MAYLKSKYDIFMYDAFPCETHIMNECPCIEVRFTKID